MTWPGSSVHFIQALAHPRWEDYNFRLDAKSKNRFSWLGNGLVRAQLGYGKITSYLDNVDIPPIINKGERVSKAETALQSVDNPGIDVAPPCNKSVLYAVSGLPT